MTYTVAIDPGVATGVAVWSNEEEALSPLTGQYDREQFFDFLDVVGPSITHLRIETFTITVATAKKSPQLEPIWFTGAALWHAWKYKFEVSWSKPADVMKKYPDAALKQAGFYNKSEHARDATRHLVACLIKSGTLDVKRFLLP